MTVTDLGLDDRVSLRVLEATEEELGAVAHQTGLHPRPVPTTPLLSLRFVDTLPLTGPLRMVGAGMGITDDAVVMAPGGPRLLVPILELGGTAELLCEHGATTVPLLMDLLNTTALAAGMLPLHAGAFVLGGVGTVVTGWSNGGKTSTVLGVMTGWPAAAFVGDDWVYVDPKTREVLGSAHPVLVRGWHVEQLPELRERLPRKDIRRFRVIRAAEQRHARLSARTRALPPAKALTAMLPLLSSRHGSYVEPAPLFGGARIAARTRLDRLVHVESGSNDETTATSADPRQIAARMAWSLRHERQELSAAYEGFRYVHPEAASNWLDGLDELEAQLLTEAFSDVPAFQVRHPYPPDIAGLARAVVASVS